MAYEFYITGVRILCNLRQTQLISFADDQEARSIPVLITNERCELLIDEGPFERFLEYETHSVISMQGTELTPQRQAAWGNAQHIQGFFPMAQTIAPSGSLCYMLSSIAVLQQYRKLDLARYLFDVLTIDQSIRSRGRCKFAGRTY